MEVINMSEFDIAKTLGDLTKGENKGQLDQIIGQISQKDRVDKLEKDLAQLRKEFDEYKKTHP